MSNCAKIYKVLLMISVVFSLIFFHNEICAISNKNPKFNSETTKFNQYSSIQEGSSINNLNEFNYNSDNKATSIFPKKYRSKYSLWGFGTGILALGSIGLIIDNTLAEKSGGWEPYHFTKFGSILGAPLGTFIGRLIGAKKDKKKAKEKYRNYNISEKNNFRWHYSRDGCCLGTFLSGGIGWMLAPKISGDLAAFIPLGYALMGIILITPWATYVGYLIGEKKDEEKYREKIEKYEFQNKKNSKRNSFQYKFVLVNIKM